MKIYCVFFILLILSHNAYAQNDKRLLVIIQPSCDSLLLELENNISQQIHNVSFYMYEPSEQCKETIDVTNELSKGKDAYEFLRFEESLSILNKVISKLSVHLNSNQLLDKLKEAYLYSAMDYIAMDKSTDARKAIDQYLCISGTTMLDTSLWHPKLVYLVKTEFNRYCDHYKQGSFISVTIATNPPQAEIFIDGNNAGTSPLTIDLLQCTHFVSARKKAYLKKDIPITISKDTRAVSIELVPNTLTISNDHLSEKQMKYMIDQYKVNGILMLSTNVTQSTLQKNILINAKVIYADSFIPSTVDFEYKNNDQAAGEIMHFIQHTQNIRAKTDITRKSIGTYDTDKKKTTSEAWYKNKWLWIAGSVIIASGVIYAATQSNSHQSSTTGSISIKW